MGVILSNPHPAVRTMLATLTQDAFANSVLTQVANGAFGPRALARYATEYDTKRASSSDGRQPPQGGPTNDWQLQTVRTIVARSQADQGTQSSGSGEPVFGSGLNPSNNYNASLGSTTTQSSMSPLDDSFIQHLGDPFKGWDFSSLFQPNLDR